MRASRRRRLGDSTTGAQGWTQAHFQTLPDSIGSSPRDTIKDTSNWPQSTCPHQIVRPGGIEKPGAALGCRVVDAGTRVGANSRRVRTRPSKLPVRSCAGNCDRKPDRLSSKDMPLARHFRIGETARDDSTGRIASPGPASTVLPPWRRRARNVVSVPSARSRLRVMMS